MNVLKSLQLNLRQLLQSSLFTIYPKTYLKIRSKTLFILIPFSLIISSKNYLLAQTTYNATSGGSCGGSPTCSSSSGNCYKLQGTATPSVSGSCVTFFGGGQTNVAGEFFNCQCVDLTTQDFSYSTTMTFGTNTSAGVGDGMAIVIKPSGASWCCGGYGRSIGYQQMAGSWFAAEIDDYQNSPGDDPSCEHAAAYTGTGSTPTISTVKSPTCLPVSEIRGSSSYTVNLSYNHTTNLITLTFNGSTVFTVTYNLATFFGASASCVNLGITSADGGVNQVHTACNTSLTVGSLPVTLTNFNGDVVDVNKIALKWNTASEKNNKEFLLYRTDNINHWDLITTIPGNGNTSYPIDYAFEDYIVENSLNDVLYYRLEQVDFDGNKQSFETISVKLLSENDLMVVPNPNNGRFDLLFKSSSYLTASLINLYNIQGQQVRPNSIKISSNTIAIDGSNLLSGLYYVTCINDEVNWINKLIIE